MAEQDESRVWGPRAGKPGPVHLAVEGFYSQAWCGARAQFRHWVRPGTAEDVTCARCVSAIKRGRPSARKSGKR